MTWALGTLALLVVLRVQSLVREWSEALQHCAFAAALDVGRGLDGFQGSENECTRLRSTWWRTIGGQRFSRIRLDMLSAGTEEAVHRKAMWRCTSTLQLMPLICSVQMSGHVLRPCGQTASKYLQIPTKGDTHRCTKRAQLKSVNCLRVTVFPHVG